MSRIRKLLATAGIAALLAIPAIAPQSASASGAQASTTASASCVNASTPGGTKCLAPGEYCSHKPGYAAAYRRAGFKCKADGRLADA